MPAHLYTYGYLAGSLQDLVDYAESGAVILDIRINPTSRNPIWRQAHLRKVLAASYQWCPELGNPNYRSGGPMALADPGSGVPIAGQLLETKPVVMLCACRDWTQCHRRLAAEAIQADDPEVRVTHLSAGEPL